MPSLERQSALQLTHFPIIEPFGENCMMIEDCQSQAFAEKVLELLEGKFPWLGKEDDDQVSAADTVHELADLYRSLIEKRTAEWRKSRDADQ